jgi:predicted  nucleic acid-binding Zn-ribbon protein
MGLNTALNRQSGARISDIINGITPDLQEVSNCLVAVGKLSSDLSAETTGLKASIVELQTKLSAMMNNDANFKTAILDKERLIKMLEILEPQLKRSEGEASIERERSRELMKLVDELKDHCQVRTSAFYCFFASRRTEH